MLPDDDCEYYIDEYQIQAIHNYIDDESNGIDSFFKRALIFYEKTGCRAAEPLLGELFGNWLYIDASKSKFSIYSYSLDLALIINSSKCSILFLIQ